MTEQYEFNDNQNQVISDLAKKMQYVSLLLMILGGVKIVSSILLLFSELEKGGLTISIEGIISGIIFFMFGFWGNSAAKDFLQVVNTQGNDVEHLMNALGNLRHAVSLAYWLLVLFLALFIIGIFSAIIIGMLGTG